MKSHRALYILSALSSAFMVLCYSCRTEGGGTEQSEEVNPFSNPVIYYAPDPSIIDDRSRTGFFYAYSTQALGDYTSTPNLPIWRSKDFVHWDKVGDAFPHRPEWREKSRVWAPDINYFDGHYVLYYALGGPDSKYNASGVAVSDTPEGPFKDLGMLVSVENTGVCNSIDPNFFEDGGHKYLFWGSYTSGSGVWMAELSDDGLSLKTGTGIINVGNENMEGTYIHKHGEYYYMFASMGSCCDGAKSSYHIVVGRSKDIHGPFVDPAGKPMTENGYSYTIMQTSVDKRFTGPGHNAEIFSDDSGQEWMPYHASWSGTGYNSRGMNIDKIYWKDGWPCFETGHPTATRQNGPVWK